MPNISVLSLAFSVDFGVDHLVYTRVLGAGSAGLVAAPLAMVTTVSATLA